MSVVYVLTEIDIDTKVERPVAVVTDEAVANDFYQKDTKNRDYIPFNLDEVPMLTGEPPKQIPEHPAEKQLREHQEQQQQTTRQQEEHNRQVHEGLQTTNKLVEEIIKRMQQNKNKKK